MSIKHRVKDRAKDGKIRPLFRVWREIVSREYQPRPAFYNTFKNPGWFNREYHNRPNRKEARRLCRDIVRGDREADAVLFPVDKKPNIYYW